MRRQLLSAVLCLVCLSGRAQVDSVKVDTLSAAVVRTDKEKRAARTQTSLQRLDSQKLRRGFAVLGSPDLIKTLQTLPGVSGGSELSSGIYVRGGDGSDNLFLLDGIPIYQVNHLIGLFSSFNTDMIEEVDFYKGGFPARYGGRLSSVVDVDLKTGSFTEWRGSAALGLVDGRFQISGPLIKNRTSINFGVRRTWLDIAKTLAMPIIRMQADDARSAEDAARNFHYDFSDFNLKIVHLLDGTGKLSLSAYYGHDYLKAKGVMDSSESEDGDSSSSSLNSYMRWGNALVSLDWDKTWEETSWAMVSRIYYTRYFSDISMTLNAEEKYEDEGMEYVMEGDMAERDYTRIHDIGVTSDWFFDGWEDHHIRMGVSGIAHFYDPYRKMDMSITVNSQPYAGDNSYSSLNYAGGEISPYVEDEITLGDRFKLNAGLRNSLFIVKGKAYNRLEPRLAVKYEVLDWLDLKASYAKMNQFSHMVSTCYIDIPTSLWMPSTSRVKPMGAGQVVLGAAVRPSESWNIDIEGFYKSMTHLYEYNGTNTLLPSLDKWEFDYMEGRGRAYGAEISVEYMAGKLFAAAYYTISKNERLFPTYYYTWYPDRYDNTHKLNLNLTYKFSPKFEVYASWAYHTGNRFTAASMVVWDQDYAGDSPSTTDEIYDMPNNYRLPDYHRMDVGLNWHRRLRSGTVRTLNLSVYNAYNRLNAFFGMLEVNGKKVYGLAYGIIPIIPTFTYSWRF